MPRERQAYTWSGCVLKRTKSASTPLVFSFFKRSTSNQAIFFMACPHQDPDWWKRAQLLLAGEVESNPGPMWYCAICTHKITSYQTSIQWIHTTPYWIHLKCSHIKLKSYSSLFICHTHQIPAPKTPSHIHNLTQKTLHTHQQTKPTIPKPTNSLFNNTKQHQHNTAQHQLNHRENN